MELTPAPLPFPLYQQDQHISTEGGLASQRKIQYRLPSMQPNSGFPNKCATEFLMARNSKTAYLNAQEEKVKSVWLKGTNTKKKDFFLCSFISFLPLFFHRARK